jgi:hypothetical protein
MDVEGNTWDRRIARARDLQNASRQFGMMMRMRHCFGTYTARGESDARRKHDMGLWLGFNVRRTVYSRRPDIHAACVCEDGRQPRKPPAHADVCVCGGGHARNS